MSEDILDILIEEVLSEYPKEDYDPDEFYADAIAELSPFGYDVKEEEVYEVEEGELPNIESDHLEVITEFTDRQDSIFLRFLLEDGRPDPEEVPKIDEVEGYTNFIIS